MEEVRKLNMMFQKSGSGSTTTRLSIPKSWVDDMGISDGEREVIAIYQNKSIVLKKASTEKKFLMIKENGNNDTVAVYDTLEEANEAADTAWYYLTAQEKKKNHVYTAYVTEEMLAPYAFEDGELDWTAYWNCNQEEGTFYFDSDNIL